MKIYFASGNIHKKKEMEKIFPEHTIVIPSKEGIPFAPEETGSSFFENSLIKAESLWKLVRQPVLADDSGICVDIIGGRPGIYSARYTGKNGSLPGAGQEKLSDSDRNALLLDEVSEALAGRSPGNGTKNPRACRFVCAMVLYMGPGRFFCAQETLEGRLVEKSGAGSGGFGYDPVVFLEREGKTVAQLTEERKNTISHRAKAGKAIRALISAL